jgi:hypothetical protein
VAEEEKSAFGRFFFALFYTEDLKMNFDTPPVRKTQPQLQNASGFLVADSYRDLGKDGASATIRTPSGDVTLTQVALHQKSAFQNDVVAGLKASAFGVLNADRSGMSVSTIASEDPMSHIRDTPFEKAAHRVETDRALLTGFVGQIKPGSFGINQSGKYSATLVTEAGPLKIETMQRDVGLKLQNAAKGGDRFMMSGTLSEDKGNVSLVLREIGAGPELKVEDPFASNEIEQRHEMDAEPAM